MHHFENNIPEISVHQLKQAADSGASFYLLDVRTLPEFIGSHLNFTDDLISYESVPALLDRLPQDKSTSLYLFCRSGHRSGLVTLYLRSLGYTNAFNVEGGILAWKAAGFKTVSGDK